MPKDLKMLRNILIGIVLAIAAVYYIPFPTYFSRTYRGMVLVEEREDREVRLDAADGGEYPKDGKAADITIHMWKFHYLLKRDAVKGKVTITPYALNANNIGEFDLFDTYNHYSLVKTDVYHLHIYNQYGEGVGSTELADIFTKDKLNSFVMTMSAYYQEDTTIQHNDPNTKTIIPTKTVYFIAPAKTSEEAIAIWRNMREGVNI
jgi:hypothetical protein